MQAFAPKQQAASPAFFKPAGAFFKPAGNDPFFRPLTSTPLKQREENQPDQSQSQVPSAGNKEGKLGAGLLPHNPVKTSGQPFFQAKLTINEPGDSYEQEADRAADRVMRLAEPAFIQRTCADCEEAIQRKPPVSLVQGQTEAGGTTQSDALSQQIQAAKGKGGNPLPPASRDLMERSFGADFSGVTVHAGCEAAQLSNQLKAQAFTVGNDIYFNEGKYAPELSAGKHLLAHESRTLSSKDRLRLCSVKVTRPVPNDMRLELRRIRPASCHRCPAWIQAKERMQDHQA